MKKKLNKNPLVSVIILTYQKGALHLEKCLKSLFRIDYPNLELIIVDNGSTDNTIEMIQNFNFKIKIIRNKKNLGFCVGNNQAAKVAKGKYLLFLNNDTLVTSGFLKILVKDLEDDKSIGVVQPKIRQLIEKNKLDACASFLTMTGFLYHYGYSQKQDEKKYNKRMYMYSVKGACFLTRKELIRKIGLFDKDYFAYFEETDFCHRVWISGSKVLYEPLAEIFHLGGTNKKVDSIIQFHSYKNRIATYIKNFEKITLFTILPLHLLMVIGISMLYLWQGKVGYSYAIISAIFWNIFNLRKILDKRTTIQEKLRVVKDVKMLSVIKKNVKVSYYKHFLLNPRGFYKFQEI